MSIQGPVIEIRFLLSLAELLRKRGVVLEDVLGDAGLDAALLEQPWTVIPLSVAGRILDRAAKLLNDNALGLHLGAHVPGLSTGILGQLTKAAPTVRDMLATLARHSELHIRQLVVSYEETPATGRLSFRYPSSFAGPDVQVSGFLMGAAVAAVRRGAGPTWMPRLAAFDHRPSEDLAAYVAELGPRIRFSADANELVVDRTALAARQPDHDQALFAALQEAAVRLGAQDVTVFDLASEVQREISSRLATGEAFDLEGVAGALGYAPRALQYRLELQTTSYEAILIETRRRLAERYLRDTDLAITEISARLGFSELSAFTRAAQRWFDMPPRSYRNHMRGRSAETRTVAARFPRALSGTPSTRAATSRRSRAAPGLPAPRSSRP